MDHSALKEKIKNFLSNHTLCVMATSNQENNQPEAAVIGFAEQDDLSLIVGTSNESRKYQNMQTNNKVALVIGWDSVGTVQYEGTIEELPVEDSAKYVEIMAVKNPFSRRFGDRPDQRYFRITPTWIRLVDHSKSPDGIHEINFN